MIKVNKMLGFCDGERVTNESVLGPDVSALATYHVSRSFQSYDQQCSAKWRLIKGIAVRKGGGKDTDGQQTRQSFAAGNK